MTVEGAASRGPDSPGRLMSLDAFRGLAIAGMILVNNPGSWSHVYAPLRHAEWHGVTPTDLIFPFFIFAIGVSLSFSFQARMDRGDTARRLWLHVLRRSAIIYALGFLMAAYPDFRMDTVRLVGVLARIAMVYLIAGTLVLFLSRRAVLASAGMLLLAYWALMTLVPVPGFGPGDLSPEGNLAAHLDRIILGAHMWQGGGGVYDPEGFLSTMPAVSSALAGVFVGDVLRVGPVRGRTALRLILVGLALLAAGLVWGRVFPLNKSLWTSSYVLYTTGWGTAVLAAMAWLIDVRGRQTWSHPLVVYGLNAIAVFVASGLLAKTLVRWHVGTATGATTSLYTWMYETLFASWAGPLNGSLAFAVATVVFWWALMWLLYRKRIFIKI